jgi:mono/diheme cytochrome c family protein
VQRLRRAALALAAAALAASGALVYWRGHAIGPVQRGKALAGGLGCFACHGPGGATGYEDPAGRVGAVPSFERLPEYAKSDAEVREWILDGRPRRTRDPGGVADGPPPLFRMPAFRGRISDGELDWLVAYVEAAADLVKPHAGSLAERGRSAAVELGCFQCHGPQGRGDTPNPRSLKGYVPSWSGSDFTELVRDDQELRDWVLDGGPRRLTGNPVARLFLERQQLHMPAYRGRVTKAELGALVAYIRWLRSGVS